MGFKRSSQKVQGLDRNYLARAQRAIEQPRNIFCILLSAAQKQTCYQTLASRLMDVFASSAQRQIVCDYFEKDYQHLCSQ